MTPTVQAWVDFCQRASDERVASKESYRALYDMYDYYKLSSPKEQAEIADYLYEVLLRRGRRSPIRRDGDHR